MFERIQEVRAYASGSNKPPVLDKFIIEALQKITSGEAKVQQYPAGGPTTQAIYQLAADLERVPGP